MWIRSSTRPTRKRKVLASRISLPYVICNEKAGEVMTTESQIATPPSIAVGFLCQRSILGTATKPKRRARARTSGVSTSARQNDAATARSVRGLKGILIIEPRISQITQNDQSDQSVGFVAKILVSSGA